MVKIGLASDPAVRLADLQVGSPVRLVLRGSHMTDDADGLERELHDKYADLRSRGEWFRVDDRLCEEMNTTFGDTVAYVRRRRDWPDPLASVRRRPGESLDDFADRACRAFIGLYPDAA